MNTSGVDDPPEISVASVARLVSVVLDAETSDTWMFGYCFSNALISTVLASLAPVPDIGLADQTMLPDVADPGAAAAEADVEVAGVLAAAEVADGLVLLPSPEPVDVLLPPLELHAASARTPAAVRAAPTPARRMKTTPSRLRDILPPEEFARDRAGIDSLFTG
jgi:hypothetical protein